jgi:hypothetical protein
MERCVEAHRSLCWSLGTCPLPYPRYVEQRLPGLRIGTCGCVFLAIGCCKFGTSGQTMLQVTKLIGVKASEGDDRFFQRDYKR